MLQFRDVPPNAYDVAADRLHGLVELLLAAARYEDKGAFVDKALRSGETYSRGAAGNHGHLSLQLAHKSVTSFADEAFRRNACGPDGFNDMSSGRRRPHDRSDVVRSLPDPLGGFPAVCRVVSDDMSNAWERKMIAHHHDSSVATRSRMALRDLIACAGS